MERIVLIGGGGHSASLIDAIPRDVTAFGNPCREVAP